MNPNGYLRRIGRVIRFFVDFRRNFNALRADLDALKGELDRSNHAHRALLVRHDILESNHKASVDWLQETYPEIVRAIGCKIGNEQLQEHTEKLFEALYRELRTLRAAPASPSVAGTVTAGAAASPAGMDDGLYLELERNFRGSREDVARRQTPYLDYLSEQARSGKSVLDIGCGRGEWLELLASHGIPAAGVDLNPINGASCRSTGLDVTTANACDYLAASPADSLGGITAFQLVEHLEFSVLAELLRQALKTLVPGGMLILETPNPENLLVATRSFWIDPTHIKPIPPELLEFAVRQTGFEIVAVLRLNPHEQYRPEATPLDLLLYGPRDYAIIARRPPSPDTKTK